MDIFKAEPRSVYDLICMQSDTGFYMPAYQRPYSWEKRNIDDLFSDFKNVFSNLLHSDEALIFLGTILCVDDSKEKTNISPKASNTHCPPKVKLVIDGQQRLSTLVLVLISLNEKLRVSLKSISKNTGEHDDFSDSVSYLKENLKELIKDTSNFVHESQAEDETFKYLPKVTRSQVDRWGKNVDVAKYDSPLSHFIVEFQKHCISYNDRNFKDFPLNILPSSSNIVATNFKAIRGHLKKVIAGQMSDEVEAEELSVSDLVDSKYFLEAIQFPISPELAELANKNSQLSEIVFLICFTKFLMRRVCITYVEVNNESYAFDMFEALNTTGEPLTAIETFTPRVIEHIGQLEDEVTTEEEKDKAEHLLATFKGITSRFEGMSSTNKNKKAKALILAFVRAQSGSAKVTTLRDQRDAMLNSFGKAIFKDNYLKRLAITADFIFENWSAEKPNADNIVNQQQKEIVNLCLRYLVDLKHDIVQPLLVQFLIKAHETEGQEQFEVAVDEFYQVLKAVTSMSVLWRAMSGGADGIDGVYKSIHEKGILDATGEYLPLRMEGQVTLSSNVFNSHNVKNYLRDALEKKILSKDPQGETTQLKWLNVCKDKPMLEKPKNIKLAILAALHGVEYDNGQFARVDSYKNAFLNLEGWNLISESEKIKRIYENNTHPDWTDPDLRTPEVYNKLGNFIVDARGDVISGGSQSWGDIRQKMLIASNSQEIQTIGSYENQELSPETRRHVAILRVEKKFDEVTHFQQWNKDSIDDRTILLLKNLWSNLYSWLE